jgi:hypothetical protein
MQYLEELVVLFPLYDKYSWVPGYPCWLTVSDMRVLEFEGQSRDQKIPLNLSNRLLIPERNVDSRNIQKASHQCLGSNWLCTDQ